MNILYLWENEIAKGLGEWLSDQGNRVIFFKEPISVRMCEENDIELIVSYTYRYIISKDIIRFVKGNIVNLHISYLPWNRGANPNQWSWIENTPKGVSIHYIDELIDNGDIIAQEIVEMNENISLKESYTLLNCQIVELFKKIYPLYPFWTEMRKKPYGKGSYHAVKEFAVYQQIILGNYDMRVKDFLQKVDMIAEKK